MKPFRVFCVLALVAGLANSPAWAQSQQPSAAPSAGAADDPDLDLDPLQPDFTVITLPTTLPVPRFRSAFRVTHRFGRPLGQGSFGSLAEDFFGLDSGAQIGLEYRFGLMTGTQVGIHRTSERTIEFFGSHAVWQERDGRPLGISAYASIDGTNNFRDEYSPAAGAVISRRIPRAGSVYVEPMWVANSNPVPSELADHDDTFLLGIGTRLRIRPTVYLLGEIIPRVAGYDPGVNQAAFALEKRLGGHSFQINFSNGFGTTMGQIARGGTSNSDWYLGFNISRKFF
jgi:hypothetical protein